jgi:putative PIN family toxin of toxin-antitoxin system
VNVFLDTNVLVSAFATRGLCADVFRLVLARHDLSISRQVIVEFRRVLKRKFSVPDMLAEEFITFLQEARVVPSPRPPFPHTVRDADDAAVLAAAIRARCDVLISGDPDLLDIAATVSELRILSPRQFWELHRTGA